MDRRKSLKAIALGTLSTGLLVDACKDSDKKVIEEKAIPETNVAGNLDRYPAEVEQYKKVTSYTFFTPHEMATITLLADIIIPKDEISGSASDAKVPEFIEFIVKDMPQHQVPMRGGLRWLDIQSMKRFEKPFKDADEKQRLEIVDDIAYPVVIDKEKPERNMNANRKLKPGLEQGVAFFSLMRNLTATGFFTSQMGVKDLGYAGNRPNKWNGVPADVLKQYGMEYTAKDLKDCISF